MVEKEACPQVPASIWFRKKLARKYLRTYMVEKEACLQVPANIWFRKKLARKYLRTYG
jgi:hypothetical protein